MGIKRFEGIESGIERRRMAARLKGIAARGLGQHCPTHYPQQPGPSGGQPSPSSDTSRLGPPLDIRQVAALLGCQPWSVRNTWIPLGLPHLRSGASSKLIFFTNQVVAWIERQQQGGNKR
jgi:hypothetical protein